LLVCLQVRECATALLHVAKREKIPIFLIGHVTKVRRPSQLEFATSRNPLTNAEWPRGSRASRAQALLHKCGQLQWLSREPLSGL